MTFSDGRPTFVNYDNKDGLGGVDFISLVALKTDSGELYFGGEHGLNRITPGSINQTPPDLLLTDLKIGDKSISQFENSIIDKSIYEAEDITLAHNQNDISFEFAALHFARAEKNQYAHKLEGYDEEWRYDNRKFASYTNLDPGEYKFIFRGSNSEGVWNDKGRAINIEILPPWWATTWAYVGYGFLFVAFIFGIDRFQKRRLLAKMRERRKLEEAESRAENAELHAKAAEAERRAMEAEYIHKKKELEEARELQLSMLPEKLPQLPNLDIAVYMNTATEVGGDYYDFHVGIDGTLTVVLGDATGHGMKAGTMVTAVKGLFNSYSANPDILYSFHEISRCIKQMRLGKLSMCMTMLKINNNKMIMSAAGMPPIMLYKSDERNAQEVVIKGMPLGTFDNYPYDVRETELKTGDTILLMSDGLPELQNNAGELFGYQRVRNTFENSAENSPEAIIEKLKSEGKSWSAEKEPDDDITFVVIKVK
jgi:serine phosphatase RsbU (regulator of sigma subunit)